MNLRCIAIDDEPLALRLINTYVSRIPNLEMVKTFENAISAAEYLRNNPIDILLIDINMPDISGIELVQLLDIKPIVIFTTAYRNFAVEGFELEAVDYLLKPISFDRFAKAIAKAAEYYRYKNNIKQQSGESIYVYSEYRMVKVSVDEIEYLESMQDYVKIYLTTGSKVITLMPLKTLLEKLPGDKFRRIHRSYAVSISKIKSIRKRRVFMENIELPVGDAYSNFLAERKGK